MTKKFFIKTYGCQMNEYDSNRISDLVEKAGYTKTENIFDIDCYILNTCHIREKATEKVYSDIGRLKKSYRNKKKPLVLITGCVAQAENEEMLKREKYIDAVIGPQSYHHFPEILNNISYKKEKINFTDFDVIEKFDTLKNVENKNSKVSSFLTIQEGCDKFCSFCVVPYTRGSEYSRSPQEIINEANKMVLKGTKEITLLGQNVNAYHYKDFKKNYKISDIIFELSKIEEIKRIRYTTSHPADMSQDLIKSYRSLPKLMPFLHLPVQSGSNKILKNMNRKYTKEKYLSIIKELLIVKPEIKFSSDFIIGYPGEDEKDFFQTIDLIKKVKFINSFSFIYNPRPGTPASTQNLLDSKTQKNRLNLVQNLLEKIQINKNKSEINKIKKVLIENKMKNQNKYFGRTEDLTPVIVESTSDKDIGEIINVEITGNNRNSLFGAKKFFKKEVAA